MSTESISSTSVVEATTSAAQTLASTVASAVHSDALTGTTPRNMSGNVAWYDAMPEDIHTLIHDHWKQFDMDEIAPAWFHAIAIFITFAGIVGVLGNMMITYIFCV